MGLSSGCTARITGNCTTWRSTCLPIWNIIQPNLRVMVGWVMGTLLREKASKPLQPVQHNPSFLACFFVHSFLSKHCCFTCECGRRSLAYSLFYFSLPSALDGIPASDYRAP